MKTKYEFQYPLRTRLAVKVEAEDERQAKRIARKQADKILLEIEGYYPQFDLLDYDPYGRYYMRKI